MFGGGIPEGIDLPLRRDGVAETMESGGMSNVKQG